MTVLQRIVLVIASVMAAVGMLAIVWRELVAPIDAPGVSRARLAIEVLLPVAGVAALLLWIWTS